MSRTYTVTGINLKGMPLGENDRILTILSKELGLIRAVAPGARKPKSRFGGRSDLFVVNQLFISKGRSLDRITQAETLKSYSGLGQNLGKLAASQYLAELVLNQALSEHPQEELFLLLDEHLTRLDTLPNSPKISTSIHIIACLTQAVYHLLALAGNAPQVQLCCLTQQPLNLNFDDPNWRAGFSIDAGGIMDLAEWTKLQKQPRLNSPQPTPTRNSNQSERRVAELQQAYTIEYTPEPIYRLSAKLTAAQVAILQQLAQPELLDPIADPLAWESSAFNWMTTERILRQYAQYQLGYPIRSGGLIDTFTQQFIVDPPF